ncbi:hypothetical protein DPMN_083419 [Dreissena polymorpha]|uniref:Uncharacterized protein n=1 Tax=Dreissena polymorpha TaxID=45954 RepID=A0A9D3Y9A9_DREPO|nr:hypothetical protein DPMN_083419 [Dreissena polymorpha]
MLKLLGASYFKAEMLDNQFQQLHLALRLSVTEGVQQMFQTYITNKEMQVQNTAETIKSSLEDGKTPVMASLKTSPSTSSVGRTRPDRSTTVFYLRGNHMLKLLGASYFKAEMLDNQFQQLHLALRLSVTEGVQQMFQTYITNKEMQVRTTAETIKSSLEDGRMPAMTTLITSPSTSSGVGTARPDRSTTVWVNMDIKTYRSS